MNLIEDAWIPARRRSGKIERIAPWQLTDRFAEDPFVGLAAPRPDFNGALVQFLIGVLQTCFAPVSERAWRVALRRPPSERELRTALAGDDVVAFALDADGPRFMQDLTLGEEVASLDLVAQEDRTKAIGDLLIDLPTGKTLRDNTDLFVKRGRVDVLCPACSATSLFSLQTNAPSGGQGHRTGIRGGGPLTTLILADTLWGTCWLNVLENETFLRSTGNSALQAPQDRYPWLGPTRTSEGGHGTTPQDAHPAEVFWAMPRRIRLLYSDTEGVCDLCAAKAPHAMREYQTKNLGVNYTGPWKHPLSPYFVGQEGAPSPIHPQPGGIGYRHWLGLVQGTSDGKASREPAAVVQRYLASGAEDLRLWAFGYDMDNMKARAWHESTMPILVCPEGIRADFAYRVTALVRGADVAAYETRNHVRKALFKPGTEVKGDTSFVSARLWQETEPAFFGTLPRIREVLTKGGDATPEVEAWSQLLLHTAEQIFDDVSQTGAFDAADPKRIALAWRDLQRALRGRKLREALGLLDKAPKKPSRKRRKEG